MDLKKIIHDDDAVSPVIGVILMVAITVILAAVIATFVLGLGDSLSNTAPQASFSFDLDEGGGTGASCDLSGTDDILTITHDGGEPIEAGSLTLSSDVGGTQDWSDCSSTDPNSDVSAGSSADANIDTSATVRVIFNSESGGSSATLGEYTGPDA